MKTNALIRGPVGTGKTHSLRTLRDCGISTRLISMEPGVEDVLGDMPCPELHWRYIRPLSLNWKEVTSFIKRMNIMGVGALADSADPNRGKYTQFLEVFYACQHFVCDRCGEDLGCADDWDETSTLAMDGLTGLCKLCMQTLVGAQPFVSLPTYKAGQEAVMSLMNMCLPLACSFILIAHVDRELDSATGKVIQTVAGIGNKLAPQLVKAFSEVIETRREGSTFFWSTDEAETKGRRLPFSSKIPPSFTQIFKPV